MGRLVSGAHASARACQQTLRFIRRNPECQRDLLQWHTMDLVHEQDFTLARSEPADKLVFLRDVFPRAIDGAAEDLRILRIFQLMRLPKSSSFS